ncbi:MAG: TonB-dependent receptor [Myxococcales bacterium]|nr:MAG: TonB-dependent receptor [Myxococcales bacterium]
MKIALNSPSESSRLPRATTRTHRAAWSAKRGFDRGFVARFAALIALSGWASFPLDAAAQEENAAPNTDGASDPAAPPAPVNGPAADGQAPAAEEEATAPDPGAAEEEAPALESQPATQNEATPDIERDSIVVTGYRKSLKAALNKKKRATEQVDAIVAEDMAEFPDLNLAESLQRMPGVAIERSEGEGARITVRGLGSRYTRTRVNGMDARAVMRSSTGVNASRSFDFNLFASELFNSVVVHKTATAELGEGALGAVVDLNTARAFDYEKGFTVLVGAQGGYNDLSNALFPRVTGLVSYHDPKGIWGATASIAYSKTRLDMASSDTVRWAKSPFRSVNGVTCEANPDDPGCAQVAGAFHPRIPRYSYSKLEGDRIGTTAGIQFRPNDKLEMKLDALYAKYDTTQNFNTLEVLFRGNEGLMDLSGIRIQPHPDRYGATNNTLSAATVNNAWVRSEATRQTSNNDFKQVTLSADWDVTDKFVIQALGGISRSGSSVPHETTLMYDDRDYNGFSYDYSNPRFPSLVYGGPDVRDPANFTLTELRDAVRKVNVGSELADLAFRYQALDQVRVTLGGTYKAERLSFDTRNRNGSACRAGLGFNCDTDGDGMADVLGPQARGDNSSLFNYPGQVGGNSNTSWTSPSLDPWINELGFYNLPANEERTNVRRIQERSYAAYLQADGEVPVGKMRLAYNAGARYVQTHQNSAGYVSTEWVEIDRDPYSDILPSANAALWVTERFVARIAGARVMARPELSDLSPGATVDSFNFQVGANNPYLKPTRAWAGDIGAEWYFADESVLSLAGFIKKIDSFPETRSGTGTFASTGYSTDVLQPTSPAAMAPEGTCGDPAGCWEISRLVNGRGATVLGSELGFAAPFSAFTKTLPVVLRDMGVTGNYTFIRSKFPWDFVGTQIEDRLLGLSTHAANATLYYDDSRFSLRGSLNWRSAFINQPDANQTGNLFSYDQPPPRLDMSSSFKITRNVQVTAEALNLTNAYVNTLVDVDAKRPQVYGRVGRTFFLGVRFTLGPKPKEELAKR